MSDQPFSRRAQFLLGARDTTPMIVGAIPFGFLFGALAVNAGLSLFGAMGMSLFVFAGSAQFVAATMLTQGAAIAVIVATTFVVNIRHALYSASLAPHVGHLPQRWLMPLGFLLTDESFAVVVKRFSSASSQQNNHWYFLGSGVAMYVNWQICTLVGIFVGNSLDGLSQWGLEFALVVTFIGIVIPMITDWPMFLAAVVGGGIALMAYDLPHNLGLLVASLSAIAVGFIAESFYKSSRAVEPGK